MDVLDAIRGRRAVRHFTSTPVSAAALRLLIDAAIQAPSAINLQPWRFAVARRRETLDHVAIAAREHLLSLMQPGSPFLRFQPMLEAPGFDILYRAPALVVICAANDTPQAAEDCAMAAQTFMLAAYAAGFGTCCIGLARPWLNQPDGKRALGIDDDWVPIVPLVVGTPATMPPNPGRQPPVTRWADEPVSG